MNENKLREQICILASSMFERGITHGSTGNISVRLDNDDILVTPSGSSFGRLDPNEIVKVTKSGQFIGLYHQPRSYHFTKLSMKQEE